LRGWQLTIWAMARTTTGIMYYLFLCKLTMRNIDNYIKINKFCCVQNVNIEIRRRKVRWIGHTLRTTQNPVKQL
jgi:hypothetical protein